MKKYKCVTTLITSVVVLCVCPVTVYANSSWRWISETRPFDILPFVIMGTLMIETIAINKFAKIHKFLKVFCVVTLGNVLSYLAPYGMLAFPSDDRLYSFRQMLEHWPTYNIGFFYLLLTIAVELPLNYFLLRKDAVSKKLLLLVIFVANVITTALVAIVERLICVGLW